MMVKGQIRWTWTLMLLGVMLLLGGCGSLAAPEDVQVDSLSQHQALISWQASPNGESYELQLASQEGDEVQVETTQDTSFTFENLTADTSYTLTLTALQGETRSDSVEISFSTLAPQVEEAAGLAVSMSQDHPLEYTLSWQPYETDQTNADGTSPAVTYSLYQCAQPDGEYQLVAEGVEETFCTITGTEELCRRYYKVCPVLTVDGREFAGPLSAQSVEVVTGITNDLELTASSTDSHSILALSWTAYDTQKLDSALKNPTVTYSVYGAYTADGEYELLISGLTEPSWRELGLLGHMTRYYKITVTVTAGDLSATSPQTAIPAGATTPYSETQLMALQEGE